MSKARGPVVASWMCAIVLGGTMGVSSCVAEAADTELISSQTVWRIHLALAPQLTRKDGELTTETRKKVPPTPLPPPDWTQPEFDDSVWGRYQDDLFDFIGGYGVAPGNAESQPALLCARTRFGIADPAKVGALGLKLRYIGGAVVYVNGKEVARGHLPQGRLGSYAAAEDYPLEAYVMPDGKPLPRPDDRRAEPYRDRYEKRIRRVSITLPRDTLVKGTNVLAIELHRAPVVGPMKGKGDWSHVGLCGVELASAGGDGVIPYAEAVKGVRVWNAWPMETITEKRMDKVPRPGPMYGFSRAVPTKGLTTNNPFEPLRPVRIAAARNGSFSGQIVLSDSDGLRDVSAKLTALSGPNGATIPSDAAQIRYAVQQEGVTFCDALMEGPPEGATILPVWVLVQVPKDQAPGWYVATLTLRANKRQFSVPLQVFVSGCALPDPKEYRSLVGLIHSPDTIALHYGVGPWSDKHFALMEPSIRLLGHLGNDVVHVPIILHDHMGHRTGMIRFVKTGEGPRPDFSALEKYLDLWTKHCPAPQVLNLIIWEPRFARTVAYAYEGTQKPKHENKESLPLLVTQLDPQTGAMSEIPAPMIGDEGSEEFCKPVVEGVRAIVRRRGWPERIIMFGMCFDWRPTPEQIESVRRWAPDVRWVGFSHWSGDPGSIFNKTVNPEGRLIALGGMEVGYREEVYQPLLPAMFPQNDKIQKLQYLVAGAHRFSIRQESSPEAYRDVAWYSGTICRLGLDYWMLDLKDKRGRKRETGLLDPRGYRGPGEWRVYTRIPWCVTAPGPSGAIPTVRYQMLREAIQETEAWISILQATAGMSDEQKQPCSQIWRDAWTGHAIAERLTQARLSLDWPATIARTYTAAGETAGVKSDAAWSEPPK